LLILRAVLGANLVIVGAAVVGPVLSDQAGDLGARHILGLLWMVGGVLVAIGLLTPVVQVSVGVSFALAVMFNWDLADRILKATAHYWPLLLLVTMLASLALLGPGAYSIDAYLFGRRRIDIPRSRLPQ
jgi:putative oxidoreductase